MTTSVYDQQDEPRRPLTTKWQLHARNAVAQDVIGIADGATVNYAMSDSNWATGRRGERCSDRPAAVPHPRSLVKDLIIVFCVCIPCTVLYLCMPLYLSSFMPRNRCSDMVTGAICVNLRRCGADTLKYSTFGRPGFALVYTLMSKSIELT